MLTVLTLITIIVVFLIVAPLVVIGAIWFGENIYGRYVDWIIDRLNI